MSSLVIIAASILDIARREKLTDRQTAVKKITPALPSAWVINYSIKSINTAPKLRANQRCFV